MMRAVTFDCWQTLITDEDFGAAVEARVAAIVRAAEGGLDEEAAQELLRRAWDAYVDHWKRGIQYGSVGMARFCCEQLGLTRETSADELCAAFEDAGEHGRVRALAGAADVLSSLRDAGVRTALVCDTGFTPGRIVRRFLEREGLLGHLEHLVFSNEVGVPKPHERMFRTALDVLEVSPAEAVHVGDLRRTDIAGAKALGMATVRIADTNDDPPGPDLPEADEVVSGHHELPDALIRLGVRLGR